MTDFGMSVHSSEDRQSPRDRTRHSRTAVSVAAEQCVRLRRETFGALGTSHDGSTLGRDLRARLRESIVLYVAALRHENLTPERTLVLVKSALLDADSMPDSHRRSVMEEAVRWAVDAYYSS